LNGRSEQSKEKGENMNIMKSAATFASLGATVLLTLAVAGCASSGGTPKTRVVEEKGYIQLHHVRDTSQALNLKKGDAAAMVCAKCKTVQYHRLTSPSWGFPYDWGLRSGPGLGSNWGWEQQRRAYEDWSQRHYCPGCKSTITITGTWLYRKEPVKHACEACGDDSIFCCATTKQGTVTKGMKR